MNDFKVKFKAAAGADVDVALSNGNEALQWCRCCGATKQSLIAQARK